MVRLPLAGPLQASVLLPTAPLSITIPSLHQTGIQAPSLLFHSAQPNRPRTTLIHLSSPSIVTISSSSPQSTVSSFYSSSSSIHQSSQAERILHQLLPSRTICAGSILRQAPHHRTAVPITKAVCSKYPIRYSSDILGTAIEYDPPACQPAP